MNDFYNQNQNNNQYSSYYNQQQVMYQLQVNEIKKRERKEIVKAGFALGAIVVLYFVVQIIMCSLLYAIPGWMNAYNDSSVFQNAFNIIAVHFFSMLIPFGLLALINKEKYTVPIVPSKKVKKSDFFLWIGVGMGACLLADYATALVQLISKNLFGYQLSQDELNGPDSIFACLIVVISTVIIPGIVEELSLRGFALGYMRKYGKGFAVFIVSIYFGLMHGNPVQFVFAFFVGMILGFITVKTDNIYIGMIIHGLNNGMSVVQDIVKYATNSNTIAENVASVIFIIWAVIGVASLIILLVNNHKKNMEFPKEPKKFNPYENSFGTKILCALPGMIIPLIIFFLLCSTNVSKV